MTSVRFDLHGDRVEFGLRLFERHPGAEPSDRAEIMIAPAVARRGVQIEYGPDLDVGHQRIFERVRHDRDDLLANPVERQRLADRVRPRAEVLAPDMSRVVLLSRKARSAGPGM